jgi:hypothetical protein
MTVKEIVRALRNLHACRESVMWAGELWEGTTAQQAWDLCPRAEWLLWLLARTGADRKLLTLAACACARTALPFLPAGEDRPRIAIEWTESWARGEASMGEQRAATNAAYAASDAARAATCAATDTAYAASDAAYAATCAATAACAANAAAAVYATAAAVYSAAAADTAAKAAANTAADAVYAVRTVDASFTTARKEAQDEMARLVRGFFPHPPTVDFA